MPLQIGKLALTQLAEALKHTVLVILIHLVKYVEKLDKSGFMLLLSAVSIQLKIALFSFAQALD